MIISTGKKNIELTPDPPKEVTMLLGTVCVFPLIVAASFAMEPSHLNGIEKRVTSCTTPRVPFGTVSCPNPSNLFQAITCSLSCDHGYTSNCGSISCFAGHLTVTESCTDTSPPVIINCPSSQTHFLESNQAKLNITWSEVKAMDSPKGDLVNVTLTSSLRPGSAYPAGNYSVRYDAKDDAGNKAYPCSFTVSIATCPSGSYIKVSNSNLDCVPCPTGTYQEHEGRLTCVPCAAGLTTTSEGSNSSSSCKGRCSPGSYSTNGMEPCSLCPIGSYQSRPGSKQCDACPVGRVTKNKGEKDLETAYVPEVSL
ncbi:hyalin-like [Haliotis rubra]|uniref:hyalin-like n=1 Tax=Haliotis rubra TaxID=36100 RepID=UPI001EE52F39|nr:hyalin-like [Haliotis rubra]